MFDKLHDGITKNEHVAAMVLTAKQHGFTLECAVFDSWYAAIDNLRWVRDCGWRWLIQFKSNRKVNVNRTGYRYVRDCAIDETGIHVWLEGYGLVRVFRIVAANGEAEHWATNDVMMGEAERARNATMAWGIDAYHRTLEQGGHMERAQVRAARAQRNHPLARGRPRLTTRAFVRFERHLVCTGMSWYWSQAAVIRRAVCTYLTHPWPAFAPSA